MFQTIKHPGKAGSVLTGMLVATLISTIITLTLSALIAIFLNSEKITWVQAGYWIMGMLFLAAFSAGKGAYIVVKRQKFVLAAMTGVLYWGMLLCATCLFFGGNMNSVPETGGIILAGSFAQILLCHSNSKKQRKFRVNQIVKLNKIAR